MTTIRELVSNAFRENNITQVGDDPEGDQYLEAEKLFLRYIRSMYGNEFGEPLTNVSVEDANTIVPPNSRIVISEGFYPTITLPDHPNDGQRFAVIDPRGLLGGGSTLTVKAGKGVIEWATEVVLGTEFIDAEWFYRADRGNWYPVNNLVAEDESPFPEEFDDLLTQWLALRISPRYGTATQAESIAITNRIAKIFKARYRQTNTVYPEVPVLIPSTQRGYGVAH